MNNARKRFLENWYSIDAKVFFVVLCLLYFATLYLKRAFIIDGIAAFEVMQERGDMWLVDFLFNLQYLAIPLFLAWTITSTTFLLWTGCFLFGYRLTFTALWKMVMIMNLIFIIPELLKVFWFLFVQTDPSYQDYVAFYPLSLMNLWPYEMVSDKWHYPLKALNLFEILYNGLLILGIYWLSGKRLMTSAQIVWSSYSLFFLLWLVYFVLAYR